LVKPAKCPNNDCDSNRFKSVDVDSKWIENFFK
jgi:hypothetical protein